MTQVKHFFPKVRLRTLLLEPGGMKRSDMLERAAMCMEEVRGSCLKAIDDKVEEVLRLSRSPSDHALARCYDLSNEIFAEAGAFGLGEVSSAAHSLCCLLGEECNRAPAAAIRVHVDAMRALRRPEIASNKRLRTAVLLELRGLVDHLKTQEA